MKILTVIGARPQFVKAVVVSQAMKRENGVEEIILHTGQHYDFKMSQIFFEELNIPPPYKNLDIGSLGHKGQTIHGAQTAAILTGVEIECLAQKPDAVLIYGDTNTTLAAALAASKLHIPVAHVEAGLRSFNLNMPEEINRILADRLSTLLFASTPTAVQNLRKEGITKGVLKTGDVMVDAIYHFRDQSRNLPASKIKDLVPTSEYFVMTLHRQENTDSMDRIESIFHALAKSPLPIIFPIHPRTRDLFTKKGFQLPPTIQSIEPVGYLEMILLQDRSQGVFTDSGGMQKESVVLGKPCYTLRDETEWVETVKEGWNQVIGTDQRKIERIFAKKDWKKKRKPFPTRKYYGDGQASKRIAHALSQMIRS